MNRHQRCLKEITNGITHIPNKVINYKQKRNERKNTSLKPSLQNTSDNDASSTQLKQTELR